MTRPNSSSKRFDRDKKYIKIHTEKKDGLTIKK